MAWRLFILALYVVAGIGSGYLIWGTRTGNLTEALNRMILEQDALRILITEQTRVIRQLTTKPDLDPVELERAQTALNDAFTQLEQRTQALNTSNRSLKSVKGELANARSSLGTCNDVQGRLEEQLERCIFEKAELMRSSAQQAPASLPRYGTSPIDRSIDVPKLPPDENPPQR